MPAVWKAFSMAAATRCPTASVFTIAMQVGPAPLIVHPKAPAWQEVPKLYLCSAMAADCLAASADTGVLQVGPAALIVRSRASAQQQLPEPCLSAESLSRPAIGAWPLLVLLACLEPVKRLVELPQSICTASECTMAMQVKPRSADGAPNGPCIAARHFQLRVVSTFSCSTALVCICTRAVPCRHM